MTLDFIIIYLLFFDLTKIILKFRFILYRSKKSSMDKINLEKRVLNTIINNFNYFFFICELLHHL